MQFFKELLGALAYPFRGSGPLALVAGTIVFAVLIFIASISPLGFFLGIPLIGYIFSCLTNIVHHTVSSDKEEPPDWPEFLSLWSGFKTFFLFFLASLISIAPLMIYLKVVGGKIDWNVLLFTSEGINQDKGPLLFWIFVLKVFSAFIIPMYFISIVILESFVALNPILILRSIFTTLPGYMVLLIFLFIFNVFYALVHLVPVFSMPFVGGFLEAALMIYFLLVIMRWFGIFYREHQSILKWIE